MAVRELIDERDGLVENGAEVLGWVRSRSASGAIAAALGVTVPGLDTFRRIGRREGINGGNAGQALEDQRYLTPAPRSFRPGPDGGGAS
jgi:hypothetical protein